jgi:predicted DNA-binding protein
MKIRDWIEELEKYSFLDKKAIKLSDNLQDHLFKDSDVNGQNMCTYIKEALYNYAPTKQRLLQYENIGKVIDNKIACLVSEEEIEKLKKVFKKKKVEITRERLLELIAAKLCMGMEL